MRNIITIGTFFITLSSFAQIPTNGLVGRWKFSGNTNDETANSNNGTNFGADLTLDRCGNANSAYEFDGSDYIECTPDAMGVTNEVSVSFWFRTTVPDTDRGVPVIKYSWTQDVGYACQFDLTHVPEMRGRDGNNVFTGSGTNGVQTNDGEWHHFVGIVDGSTWTTWIDTVMVGTVDNGHNNVNIGSCPLPLTFGRLAELTQSGYQYYTGTLDDVTIYNRAISQAEIVQLFNDDCSTVSHPELEAFVGGVYPNPANEVLHVNLSNHSTNEIATATLVDVAGRRHDFDLEKLQTEGTVNVSEFANGIYILTIELKGLKESFRIVIE